MEASLREARLMDPGVEVVVVAGGIEDPGIPSS